MKLYKAKKVDEGVLPVTSRDEQEKMTLSPRYTTSLLIQLGKYDQYIFMSIVCSACNYYIVYIIVYSLT